MKTKEAEVDAKGSTFITCMATYSLRTDIAFHFHSTNFSLSLLVYKLE